MRACARLLVFLVGLGACEGGYVRKGRVERLEAQVAGLAALSVQRNGVVWRDARGQLAVGVVPGLVSNGLRVFEANYVDENGYFWVVDVRTGSVRAAGEPGWLLYRTLDCSDEHPAADVVLPRMTIGYEGMGYFAAADDATFAWSSEFHAARSTAFFDDDDCHEVPEVGYELQVFVPSKMVRVAEAVPVLPYVFPLHPEVL